MSREAAIRLHGASLTGVHDFSGPMAKPQRMALATLACLVMAAMDYLGLSMKVIPWLVGLMTAGILVTILRRLRFLSRNLRDRSSQ